MGKKNDPTSLSFTCLPADGVRNLIKPILSTEDPSPGTMLKAVSRLLPEVSPSLLNLSNVLHNVQCLFIKEKTNFIINYTLGTVLK